MAKTKKKPVPEQNPVEVPLYTPWDIARYLRLPLPVVSNLTGRIRGWPVSDLFRHFWRDLPLPFLFDDDQSLPPNYPDKGSRISFHRLADLFVKAGVLQPLLTWPQSGEKSLEQWENLHHTVWRVLDDLRREPVPFETTTLAERVDRLSEPFSRNLDEGNANLIRKQLTLRLDRVETDGGIPIRIYPPTRDPAEKSPRVVVLDPRIRFGRPTVAGRGIPTDSLFGRFLAGDSASALAKDYGLTTSEVEEAIRFESRPPATMMPFIGW